MTNAKALCLNMIVKNETANLGRCLAAVADHVACWVITDTGSTDGTQDLIQDFFRERGINGELHTAPFENFAQARNAALTHAYDSALSYDYLLLADADMELVVEDPEFRSKLTAPGYALLQRAGVSYWNTRLVRRDAGARYHGVTHEYLDLPGGGERLERVWYKDHASGSNRVDKFERDIKLLLSGLEEEPDSRRYWFYLAQSYRDARRTREAADTYAKRAELGGWEEEAWYARYQEARCRRTLGDEQGFLNGALAAFNQRPQRAEPLYDLARYYRERGMNDASILFCEAGLRLPRPDSDVLFIDDGVYEWGLEEEYSIVANYSAEPARKDRGFAACNWLTLNRGLAESTRSLARANLRFYLTPLSVLAPSYAERPLAMEPGEGRRAAPPSVTRSGEDIVVLQDFEPADGSIGAAPAGFLMLDLAADLSVTGSRELPAPMREGESCSLLPFAQRGELWLRLCAGARQGVGRVDAGGSEAARIVEWRALGPVDGALVCWAPVVGSAEAHFVASLDPLLVVRCDGETVAESTPGIAADGFRGASQVIRFGTGWLFVVHERVQGFGADAWIHYHRFVWLDAAYEMRGVSRPFYFRRKGPETAAGLAWHPDGKRLLLSVGNGAGEGWIATVEATEIRCAIQDCRALPSGRTVAREAAAGRPAPDRGVLDAPIPRQRATPGSPKVCVAVVALQKDPMLSFYLMCIEALDYPKEAIVLCVRGDENSPLGAAILKEWLGRVGHQYAGVDLDMRGDAGGAADSAEPGQFAIMGRLRRHCMDRALALGCDYFFIADIDNFVLPETLRDLVEADRPIVAPLLRPFDPANRLSTFHDRVGSTGYFAPSENYQPLLTQQQKGLHEVALVRGTYLVRQDVIHKLSYDDGSGRHPYVMFADSARRNGVAQYLDNRKLYGQLCGDDRPDQAVDRLGHRIASGLIAAQQAEAAQRQRRRVEKPSRPIFIHANWRASSTWFWSKFRQFPDTLCYFEPFNDLLNSLRRDQALAWDYKWWDSGHSPSTPYCIEYLPLIRRGRTGGVRLFTRPIPYDWFIPAGGLRGALRDPEKRYLALLLRHAEHARKAPVLGFTNSLGRIWPMKVAFGGLHLFQYRSLWKQWQSYLTYRRRKTNFFYETVPRLVNRTDEPFFAGLRETYLRRASPENGTLPRGAAALERLLRLPEPDIFALFMAMHVYLYLHAQLMADLSLDVTRMGREPQYRALIEEELRDLTNLPLSFTDVGDDRRPGSPQFDTAAIDWAAIGDHACGAARALAAHADAAMLERGAQEIVDAARADCELGGRRRPARKLAAEA